MFNFVSGKHSQQDARKCADRLNSECKFGKTLASMQTALNSINSMKMTCRSMLFCRDQHDVPASQSAQDCLQTMKSYGIQNDNYRTICNPVRRNKLKSVHRTLQFVECNSFNHWVECPRWSISDLLHLR